MSTAAEALPPAFWGLPPDSMAQSASGAGAGSAEPKTKFISLLNGELVEAEPQTDNPDLFGENGFGFGDFLDIINPLQHIPIISTVYRALTGDEISTGARLAGGTLYGGPLGLIGAVVNEAVQDATGRDVGDNALAMMGFDDGVVAGEAVADASGLAPEESAAQPPVVPQPGEAPGEAMTLAAMTRAAAVEPIPIRPADVARATAQASASAPSDTGALELSAGAQAALLRLTGAPASVPQLAQSETVRDARPASRRPAAQDDGAAQTRTAAAAAAPVALTPRAKPIQTASLLTAQESAAAATDTLSPDQIPSAMMAALEKYEALRKGRTANPS